MKKILYFITKADMGGAQKVVYDLAKYTANKYNVTVLVGESGCLTKWITDNNLNVRVIYLKNLERDVSLKRDILCLFELLKLFKKESYDIIHCHSAKAGAIGRVAGYLCGIKKVIYTVHGFGSSINIYQSRYKNFLHSTIEYLLSFFTTYIVTVSKDDLETARNLKISSKKLRVIYNGIILSFANRRESDKDDINKIVTVARIEKQKDWINTVRALKELKNEGVNFKFYWLGDGSQNMELKKFVEDNDMTNEILLMGNQENVCEYLQQADIFLLLSKWEGLPISIIEALFVGLPIVASDVGGNNELVSDGKNGYLIRDNSDKKAICNKIITILNNSEIKKRMGHESQIYANKNFSLNKMLKEYMKLYEE